MEKSRKVAEALYEELKMLSGSSEKCRLQFRADNGGFVTVDTNVTDVFEDKETCYLVAGNGLTLQLHQLVAINGKPVEAFC